ncbi:FimV/HubP family polar landmark protein [Kangiella sp. HZ709]|uniref:FimV/HubP family polar landmark protein n=1 Tax=Kangiella sp. HZ709 TaxID=2666328 RepID=UPI0012AFD6E3|nr:FimV/HubP family polar landmark protein [Kangiella sp. HZ709]MRX26744.1 hypothetical protein [Kangiella sp. HZ709]
MKHQKKLIKIAISSILGSALISPLAWSLGLGEIESKTQLNQPLTAKIKLLSANEFTNDDMSARIASFEAYNKFGVNREAIHSQLSFEIQTNADGSKYIQVSTSRPIKEPFLNFLVEFSWPQGRLFREYTVLLDPPAISNNKAQVIATPVTRPAANSETLTSADPIKRNTGVTQQDSSSETVATTPAPVPQKSKRTPGKTTPRVKFSEDGLRVNRGDTLWSIATRVRPEGASVSQTLAALYRNNPNAFINNDIDRLRAGVSLQVPPSSQVQAIESSISYKDLKNKNSNDAPLDVRKTITETAIANNESTAGRLTISSVTESDLTDTSGANVEEGATGDNSQGTEQELIKTVESLRLENEQLKQQLESVASDNEQGLALEDETLSVIAGSAQAVDDEDEALQSLAAKTEEAIKAVQAQNDENSTIPDSAVVNTGSKPIETSSNKPAAIAGKSFWQQEGFWKWPLIIIAALLSLLGLGFFLKKRQSELDTELFVEESNIGSKLKRTQPSFKPSEKSGLEVDTDPLDEADILIARGELQEVETLLLSVLETDSDNHAVRVKLMEVYASNDDKDGLKEQYQQLGSSFDHDSGLGLKVASLMQLTAEQVAPITDVEVAEGLFVTEDEVFASDSSDNSNSSDEHYSDESDSVASEIDFSDEMDDILDKRIEEAVATGDDVEFDLSDEEAETKLELAKAYISMGDEESASEILKEVEAGASPQQRDVALDLMKSL